MSKWEIKLIGDLCSRFSSGKNITADRISEYGEYPVYGGNGLRGYTNNYNFDGKCVLIGRQGAYCGNVRYFEGKAFISEHAIVAVSNSENCTRYLAYKFDTMKLGRFSGQAAQPGLSVSKLAKLSIQVPSLRVQEKISSILSAYDDLIEANNRRIELLEQTAQELYKEWFVRFRFPGHEKAKFENGLPKGWNVVKLGDYVDIKGGKRLPEGKTLCGGITEHPYIRIRDITTAKFISLTNSFEYIDDETFDIIQRFTVNTNDILISIVGTIGAIACVGKSLDGANLTENCVKLVNVIHFTNGYLYHFFNSDAGKGAIQAGIVGATQPKLPIYNIRRIKLLKPNADLIVAFTEVIEPIDQEIMILMDKNRNLAAQRDLLLPRLMSGKLEV